MAAVESEKGLLATCIELARAELLKRPGCDPGGLWGARVPSGDVGRFKVTRTELSVFVEETSMEDSDDLRTITFRCRSDPVVLETCSLLLDVCRLSDSLDTDEWLVLAFVKLEGGDDVMGREGEWNDDRNSRMTAEVGDRNPVGDIVPDDLGESFATDAQLRPSGDLERWTGERCCSGLSIKLWVLEGGLLLLVVDRGGTERPCIDKLLTERPPEREAR